MNVPEFLFYTVLLALVSSIPLLEKGRVGEVSANVVNSRPETWRDLLTINKVTDLNGFISLLVTRDGQPVREEDLFSPDESRDGKQLIAGSVGVMAVPDECSPRNMSVRLDLNVTDPAVAYMPECTMVERCGGCTPTPYLVCVPSSMEIIVLHVIKARYPFPGSPHLVPEGFTPVRVERHLTCRVTCTLKREDCGNHSTFIQNLCRCQCKQTAHCTNNKVWDEDQCQCRCRNETSCCGPTDVDGRTCTMFFDTDHCECTLKESVGGDPRASQAEMEAWLRSRNMGGGPNNSSNLFRMGPLAPVNANHAPPPTTTTTTSTSTTTLRPTTQASCSHLDCPRNMLGVMNESGRCLCRLPDQGQRHSESHG